MSRPDGPDERPFPATKARGGEVVRTRGQLTYLIAVFVALIVAAVAVLAFT
jgi:hypothetical protein